MLKFEDWCYYVFTSSDPPDEVYQLGDVQTLTYATRAFENARQVFAPFSDDEIRDGLWSFASEWGLHGLADMSIDYDLRLRCVQSIYTLYTDLFMVRCEPYLSAMRQDEPNRLNTLCYMWWDIFPFYGNLSGDERKPNEFLPLLERILSLDHIACQESALHGLGHMSANRTEIERMIDAYLKRNTHISESLRNYALSARGGCVL